MSFSTVNLCVITYVYETVAILGVVSSLSEQNFLLGGGRSKCQLQPKYLWHNKYLDVGYVYDNNNCYDDKVCSTRNHTFFNFRNITGP